MRTSDIALGAIALAVAAFSLTNINGSPFRSWERLNSGFPLGRCRFALATVGIVLMVRRRFRRRAAGALAARRIC